MDVSWYGRIDVMTATQLFSPRDLEPRDIGTPSRCAGTLEPRDIGTPGKCTRWGKGIDPITGKGHRPKERHFSGIPSGVVGGFSTAWFMAKLLMEVTTSWVGACCSQVQFLVSLFPRLQGRCGPRRSTKTAFSSSVTRWGRKFQDPRCGSTRQPRWRLMRRSSHLFGDSDVARL